MNTHSDSGLLELIYGVHTTISATNMQKLLSILKLLVNVIKIIQKKAVLKLW